MRATAEPLEGNKVKLSVEVEEQEFEKAVDDAFRKIAREVRIPGFRPGKAPRKLLEARIGLEAAREQAIRDALPEYFAQAAIDTETDVIAPPEIDITTGRESGPLVFDAVVEIRPKVQIPGYAGLRVTVPKPEVGDDEIGAQIDRLRRQSGALSTVERAAADGDQVSIDIKGEHDGEVVPGLTADDYLYEVGTGAVVPELDDQLRGAKAGDILAFEAPVPGSDDGSTLSFRVLVKDVREVVLPEATDEWAAEASEFDTLAELEADIRTRMGQLRKITAVMALRNNALDALAALVEDDVPEALVGATMQERLHDLAHRLEHQGATIPEYIASTGRSEPDFLMELRESATAGVRADLALRALIEAEGIEAGDDDIDAEIARFAERAGEDPAKVKAQLTADDRITEIRFDLSKSKAVDWLAEHVEIVDEEGHPIDRSLLSLEREGGDEAEQEAEQPVAADDEGESSE